MRKRKNRELPITVSMGFSYGDGKHDEIGRVALSNLNLAEVRGGDQAVVKEKEEGKDPIFLWRRDSLCYQAHPYTNSCDDDSYFRKN